jgi:hypothetical protein
MTALAWDEVGERWFETGVDRGVLYIHGDPGSAVAWNGLSSVTEILAREVKSYYTDGIRYLTHQVLGAYSATLQAYTYPEELDDLTGVEAFEPGVFLHDQRAKAFSLCYRTRVGNDVDGSDAGYKLHLIYNVMASPNNRQYNSLSNNPAITPFEWSLAGVPPLALGIRPTSHISIDSRSIDPDLLTTIENLLYGTGLADPSLPDLIDLLETVETFYAV